MKFTSSDISTLHFVIDRTKGIIEVCSKLGEIKKLQAACRMWLVRRHVATGEQRSRIALKNFHYNRLVKREENYVEQLATIVNKYLHPLRARLMQGKEILPVEDLALIFSNIESLHETHTKQLAKLHDIGVAWFVGDIGKVRPLLDDAG